MKKNFLTLGCLLIISISFAQSFNWPDYKEEIRMLKQPRERWDPPASAIRNTSLTDSEKNIFTGLDFGAPPDWNWIKQFGGSGKDNARDIITDQAGNIMVCGSFSGMIGIGDSVINSEGNRDAFIAKFQDNGELLWIRHFPASSDEEIEANGMFIDNTGKIYFTGFYTEVATIGDFILTTNKDFTTFLAWMDTNGNVIMAKNLPEYTGSSCGFSVEKDGSGNIYILGSTSSTTDSYINHTVIFKCDQSGNLISNFLNEQNFCGMKISGEHIYFAGTINSIGYIGEFYFEPTSYSDVFIARSDLDFNFNWAYMAGHISYGYSRGYDMYLSSNENIYFTSYYFSNITFGENELFGAGIFIGKCNSTGDIQWLSNAWPPGTSNLTTGICGDDNFVYHSSSTFDNSLQENIPAISMYSALTGEYMDYTIFDYAVPHMDLNPTDNKINLFGEKDQLLLVSQVEINLIENWNVEFDGNSAYGDIYATCTDHLGYLYLYGYASNNLDYFGQTIEKGMFLAKQDNAGNLLWLKSLQDSYFSYATGNYLTVDTVQEQVYITGDFYHLLNIPGGPTLTPVENGSLFIVSYDLEGNYTMSLQENFPGKLLNLETDHSGNVLLGGKFNTQITIGNTILTPLGFEDFFISKYDQQGNFLWAMRAGGEGADDFDYESYIATDATDNIYFAGEVDGEIGSVDDYSVTMNIGDGNILMSKINANGNVIWVKVKGGSPIQWYDEYCWPTALKSDPDGYFYMKGQHNDSTHFDDIVLTSSHSRYSKFIAKFDPDGNTLWANSINEVHYGNGYNQIDIDNQGNVYMGGVSRDSLFFGNDFTYVNSGASDLFSAKYSNNGGLEWVKIITGSTTTGNLFRSMAVSDEMAVYMSGRFSSYLNFGNSYTLTSNNQHGFISLIGEPNWITMYEKKSGTDLFDIYPNPTQGKFTLNFKIPPDNTSTIFITTLEGKVINSYQVYDSSEEFQFDFTSLPSGIYFIQYRSGDQFESEKLMIK